MVESSMQNETSCAINAESFILFQLTIINNVRIKHLNFFQKVYVMNTHSFKAGKEAISFCPENMSFSKIAPESIFLEIILFKKIKKEKRKKKVRIKNLLWQTLKMKD